MIKEIKPAETAGDNPLLSLGDFPQFGIIESNEKFGDMETLFNSRAWLRDALETKGAKVIGGGVGCGQADLDIVLEGCRFNVSIRPI